MRVLAQSMEVNGDGAQWLVRDLRAKAGHPAPTPPDELPSTLPPSSGDPLDEADRTALDERLAAKALVIALSELDLDLRLLCGG